LSDACYAASGVILLLIFAFVLRFPLTSDIVFLCLSLANALGILLCLRGQRAPIRLSLRKRTFQRYGKLWPEIFWSLAGAVTTTIQGQCQMLLVAGLVGPAAFAPIAAGFVFTSPIRIFAGSMLNVLRPDLSRKSVSGDLKAVRKMASFTGWLFMLFCMAYGLCLWLVWPLLKEHLYSGSFSTEPMAFIVTIVWLTSTISCSYEPFIALGQVRSRFRDITIAQLIGGIVGFVVVLTLLLCYGAIPSTLGVLIGECVTVFLLYRVARLLLEGRILPARA
jgi:O-antigen/teichoic acid export membrane protein